MSITLVEHPVPLRQLEDGTLRIGNSRIPLERVVTEFLDGSTPEEIVHQFPTLELGDVYAVISYYLAHRDSIDEYMQVRRREADELRREAEARFDPTGIRERLLARQQRATELKE